MNRIRRQRGLSIVEVMIGLTIGLVLLASLSYLLVRNSTGRGELDKAMQQIENGRYALQLLKDELRLAGYYGPSYSVGQAPAVLPDPCATDIASLESGLALAVQGYAQPSSNPLGACHADANLVLANDILVLRRAQTATVGVPPPDAGAVYLQANGHEYVLDAGANASSFDLEDRNGTAPLRPYSVHIYYVSPCDVPASGSECNGMTDDRGTPIPTLKRLELTSSGWRTVPLAQGIERFHVEYGVDSDDDGAPNSYEIASGIGAAEDWMDVVTVRVHLLVRNTRTSPDYTDEKSYVLGPPGSATAIAIPAPMDGYKRHVFSETVRLINVSGRRES